MAGKPKKKTTKSALDIALRRERIEVLTLMEFTPRQIQELMSTIPLRTIERDVAAIREKWRREGEGLPAKEQLREQMVRKAKRVENRAWLVENKAKSPSEKVGAQRVALKAQERQAKLLGLDLTKEEGVSMQAVDQYIDQLGMGVVAAVQEVIPDADTRAALLGAIEERWATIALVPNKPGSSRSSEG